MSKTCVVMQPTYIPWVGYFDLIDLSDVFVFYNDVQFLKRSWQSRNQIKTINGTQFLTIPTLTTNRDNLINEVKFCNDTHWAKKHLTSLFLSYKKSTYFEETFPFIEGLLMEEYEFFQDFNMGIIKEICAKIGISTPFVMSSDLTKTNAIKDHRLLEICLELNCDTYVSTPGSSDYIELINPEGAFRNSQVQLLYHNYSPVTYPQNFGSFISHLSIVDLLFNVGFNNALTVIKNGRKQFLKSNDLPKKQEAI